MILAKKNKTKKQEITHLKNKIRKHKKIFPILNNDDHKYKRDLNNYNQRTGYLGELIVIDRLQSIILAHDLILFNDLYLSLNEKVMQIDHILISKNCVFVIETKNWFINTFGEITQNEWFQIHGNKKVYVNSPIKQNYSHLTFLLKILKQNKNIITENLFVFNIVVFVNNNLRMTCDSYSYNNIHFKALNFCDLNNYINNVLNQNMYLNKDYSRFVSHSILKSNEFKNIAFHLSKWKG